MLSTHTFDEVTNASGASSVPGLTCQSFSNPHQKKYLTDSLLQYGFGDECSRTTLVEALDVQSVMRGNQARQIARMPSRSRATREVRSFENVVLYQQYDDTFSRSII